MAFASLKPDYSVQFPYQPTDRMAVILKETNLPNWRIALDCKPLQYSVLANGSTVMCLL